MTDTIDDVVSDEITVAYAAKNLAPHLQITISVPKAQRNKELYAKKDREVEEFVRKIYLKIETKEEELFRAVGIVAPHEKAAYRVRLELHQSYLKHI